MTLPPVVIELPAQEASSTHISQLIESCTQAVSDGECRVGALEGTLPRAVAIVSWDSDHTHARIEIGIRRDDGSHWLTRDVEFRDADPESERWRSVGLMIGTLVGETERKAATATEPDARPRPAEPERVVIPARAPAVVTTRSRTKRVWLGIEAGTGPGLDEGAFRFGAGVVAVWELPWEPALGSASVHYFSRARDDRGVRVEWMSAAVGGGIHARAATDIRLESRVQATLERVEAAVEGVESDQGSRFAPGLRISAVGGVESGTLAFLAGADIDARFRGTRVLLRGADAGRAPPLTWTVQVGARLGF